MNDCSEEYEGIEITRGSDSLVTVSIPEGAFDTVIGSTVFFTVKPESAVADDDTSDTAAIIKKQVTLSAETLDVDFDITHEDTEGLTVGDYVCGAQIVLADGKVHEIEFVPNGFRVVADITRRTT